MAAIIPSSIKHHLGTLFEIHFLQNTLKTWSKGLYRLRGRTTKTVGEGGSPIFVTIIEGMKHFCLPMGYHRNKFRDSSLQNWHLLPQCWSFPTYPAAIDDLCRTSHNEGDVWNYSIERSVMLAQTYPTSGWNYWFIITMHFNQVSGKLCANITDFSRD